MLVLDSQKDDKKNTHSTGNRQYGELRRSSVLTAQSYGGRVPDEQDSLGATKLHDAGDQHAFADR